MGTETRLLTYESTHCVKMNADIEKTIENFPTCLSLYVDYQSKFPVVKQVERISPDNV